MNPSTVKDISVMRQRGLVTYRLLSDNMLSRGSLGARGLLILDSGSGCVPGSAVGLLRGGGEPVEETVAKHCEGLCS